MSIKVKFGSQIIMVNHLGFGEDQHDGLMNGYHRVEMSFELQYIGSCSIPDHDIY